MDSKNCNIIVIVKFQNIYQMLRFLLWLIILKRRVEQLFMTLVLVLVTLVIFRISALYATENIVDRILWVIWGNLVIRKGKTSFLSEKFIKNMLPSTLINRLSENEKLLLISSTAWAPLKVKSYEPWYAGQV